MIHSTVTTQPPRLSLRVCHVLQVSDARVLTPYLAATPRANVKDVVKDDVYHPAVTDSDDDLIPIPLHDILNERANPRAKMHQCLAPLCSGHDAGERAFAAPICGEFLR